LVILLLPVSLFLPSSSSFLPSFLPIFPSISFIVYR
jgi:hypothetical protein